MLMHRELSSCSWTNGPPKQIMRLNMTHEQFEALVSCTFKIFNEDQGIEWGTGFFVDCVGEIAIIEDENFRGMLVILAARDVDPSVVSRSILKEFAISENLAEIIQP